MQPSQTTISQWLSRLPNNGKTKPPEGLRRMSVGPERAITSCDMPIRIVNEDVWRPLPRIPRAQSNGTAYRELDLSDIKIEYKNCKHCGIPTPAKDPNSEAWFNHRRDCLGEIALQDGAPPMEHIDGELTAEEIGEMVDSGVCPFCQAVFDEYPEDDEVEHTTIDEHLSPGAGVDRCTQLGLYRRWVKANIGASAWCKTCKLWSEELWRTSSLELLGTLPPYKVPAAELLGNCTCSANSNTVLFAEHMCRELLPFYCVHCRDFTQTCKVVAVVRDGALRAYLPDHTKECKDSCPKHLELKQLRQEMEPIMGKWWCDQCMDYSAEKRRTCEFIEDADWPPSNLVQDCYCAFARYWCTDCECYSVDMWERVGRSYYELDDSDDGYTPKAAPQGFQKCPHKCKRRVREYMNQAFCETCKKPSSTAWDERNPDVKCPYNFPPCDSHAAVPMEVAAEPVQQRSLSLSQMPTQRDF